MSGHRALRRRVPARKATYRDVLDAPPHMVAEIVKGALHTQPRPASWWIVDEPELHFGEDILVPDLAGWRRERMPDYPDTPYFALAPDWVCEILSPSTRTFDLEEKRPIYAREGVAHLWFVDPAARTLEAFVLHRRGWTPAGSAREDEPVSLPPFEAVTFPLDALWP